MRNWIDGRGFFIGRILHWSMLALVLVPPSPVSASRHVYDLLANQDWSHLAGAMVMDDGGVQVRPLGRTIEALGGAARAPDPPVNLRGPRLAVSGNFQVSATMRQASDGAAFQFYTDAPTIYDEWRAEPPSMRVSTHGDRVLVELWDGSDSQPVESQSFATDLNDTYTLTLQFQGDQLTVLYNGQPLGSLSNHHIFDGQELLFGLDNTMVDNSAWELQTLRAESLPGGRVRIVSPLPLDLPHHSSSALRTIAAHRSRTLAIGTAVAAGPLFTDSTYRRLAAAQFSLFTPENELKAQFVHPQPSVYDFSEADSIVDFAVHNDITVHGHTLVFGEAIPAWMLQAPVADRERIMADHITTVVSHFRSRITEWDVVSEPLSDDPADYITDHRGLRSHLWFDAMGEQYIDIALRAAHEADPAAKLYINEYGLEQDGPRWDAMLALIQRLRARGAPLDGIGFETHVYDAADWIEPDVLRRHMQILADLGLSSRISEMDVHGDTLQAQADEYEAVLRACLDTDTCTSFTTWGITDRYGSTTEPETYPPEFGDSLLWDADFEPKQAYSTLKQALRESG